MRTFVCVALVGLLALSACATAPEAPAAVGLMDVIARPGERALLNGIRAYEDGQYADAEKQLHRALQTGLRSAADQAAAHKHLAFIYCTSSRTRDCEAAFRAARQVDPSFALTKSEAGHPVWGPVYRRVQP